MSWSLMWHLWCGTQASGHEITSLTPSLTWLSDTSFNFQFWFNMQCEVQFAEPFPVHVFIWCVQHAMGFSLMEDLIGHLAWSVRGNSIRKQWVLHLSRRDPMESQFVRWNAVQWNGVHHAQLPSLILEFMIGFQLSSVHLASSRIKSCSSRIKWDSNESGSRQTGDLFNRQFNLFISRLNSGDSFSFL